MYIDSILKPLKAEDVNKGNYEYCIFTRTAYDTNSNLDYFTFPSILIILRFLKVRSKLYNMPTYPYNHV